jgi:hypothetical protein
MQKPASDQKQTRKGLPANLLWLALFALIPFLVVGGFWSAMDLRTNSEIIEREHAIGVDHPRPPDQERFINSLRLGAERGLPWAVGGLVFGGVVLAYHLRQEEKRLHRSKQARK